MGMAASWMGAGVSVVVVVVRARWTGFIAYCGWAAGFLRTTAFLALFTLLLLITTAGRAFCATWIAPPPIIAPPHAQAQSFAKAIRTDMSLSFLPAAFFQPGWADAASPPYERQPSVHNKLINLLLKMSSAKAKGRWLAHMVNVPFGGGFSPEG